MAKEQKRPIDASHIDVKLKPLFGVAPESYIKVLFWTIIGLLVFFLFFLPGIVSFGSRVSFISSPAGASVYVDGIRKGSTPLKTFIKAGPHRVVFKKPFSTDTETTMITKGRLFFSLFTPKRQEIAASIRLVDAAGLMRSAFLEKSEWQATAVTKAFPYPPIFADAARTLSASWSELSASDRDLVRVWMRQGLALVENDAGLSDYLIALKTLNDKGLNFTLEEITGAKLNGAKTLKFVDVLAVTAAAPHPSDAIVRNGPALPPLSVAGFSFRYAPAAASIVGDRTLFTDESDYAYFPRPIALDGFYYMETLAVAGDVSRTDALKRAESITALLKDRGMGDYECRLPSEAEWEYLARARSIAVTGYEWTNDSYYAYARALFALSAPPAPVFETREATIKGSPLSAALEVGRRGAQPSDWSSPYVGYRFVIAKKSSAN